MIVIASSDPRERAALAALCASRDWPVAECDSLGALRRTLRRSQPRAVLTRQKLRDGFSDDVIAQLAEARYLPASRVVVLAPAGASSAVEARQVALGADCVLRDPVRTDVLLAYLNKFTRTTGSGTAHTSRRPARAAGFAGAQFRPADRRLQRGRITAPLTPREVQLIELLLLSRGNVLSYEFLYSEILGRPFRGDTSNMRVLLGKLGTSVAHLGITLREWIEVIPKSGYRYSGTRAPAVAVSRSRPPFLSAA